MRVDEEDLKDFLEEREAIKRARQWNLWVTATFVIHGVMSGWGRGSLPGAPERSSRGGPH
jgi:hypothetical protein